MRLPALVGLSACELFGVKACTDILIPGMRVTLTDSVTGQPIVGVDGRVVAVDDRYADTAKLSRETNNPLFLVEDRPGSYRVEAAVSGYLLWVRDGIRVTKADRCHVQTTDLVIRMAR